MDGGTLTASGAQMPIAKPTSHYAGLTGDNFISWTGTFVVFLSRDFGMLTPRTRLKVTPVPFNIIKCFEINENSARELLVHNIKRSYPGQNSRAFLHKSVYLISCRQWPHKPRRISNDSNVFVCFVFLFINRNKLYAQGPNLGSESNYPINVHCVHSSFQMFLKQSAN